MKSILDTYLRKNKEYLSKRVSVYLFILWAFSLSVSAQTIFTTSGTYTVPAGVTSIKVECIGGGGAGSSIKDNSGKGGGGGGGGAYASSIINVTAGTSYTVVVGVGGVGTNGNSPRDNGGNSSFDATAVVAAGGLGGDNNSFGGGAGGATNLSTGTIVYAGGAGGSGTLTAIYSGAGGGAAGTNGAGGAASGVTPGIGTASFGGDGAAGLTVVNNGNPGNTYGGGGSGALTTTSNNRAGGVGGSGVVVITVASVTNIVEVNATLGTALTYYTTLKGAFDAINSGTHQGSIQIKINKSTTETATASLNASGTGGASYTSIALYPTSSGLSVTGSLPTPLIQLNGATNVTIDGRVDQLDTADLVISNTNTGVGARTIELINSASNNNIQYCKINGAGAATTQGVVNFSTSSSGTGNDGNYIKYCYITGISAANRPANAICSTGTVGSENSGNTIMNNKIFNCLSPTTVSNAIYISSGSTGFTITGNSLYETASFAPTASVEYTIIRIDNPSGNNFVISGNYIGGSSALCAGNPWVKTNASNNTFTAIYLNLGTSNNSVQGNTIKNFNYANNGAANWYGIYDAGGILNIGASSPNIIGAAIGTGSILFRGGATGATFSGICIASSNTTTCSKNIIGSITAGASTTSNATNFYGIYKTATTGTTTISNNVIGSTTTVGSINTSSTATGNSQLLYGIYSLGSGTITISGNTIQNLVNSTIETTASSRVRGIIVNAGRNLVQNNSISSLKTGGLSNGASNDNASLVGISLISTVVNQDISSNTINGIETSAIGKIDMYGIYYNGATSGTITRNFVSNFIIPSGGSTSSILQGVSLYAGTYTAANNIVYLGNNISVGCSIWGIYTNSSNAIKIYHNTVYLSGSAPNNTSNCFSLGVANCPSTTDVRNNILWNARNSTGTTRNYAISLNCSTNMTIDYNDYSYSIAFGVIGSTSYNTFASWQTALNVSPNYNELHSLNADPLLTNPGGASPVDYQTKTQLQGVSGTGITTDFDGVTRTTPTMGAWEFFASPVEIWKAGIKQNAYTTLKGAFDVINAGTYTGDLTIKLMGSTTENLAAVLNASGVDSASYSKILIYPGRSGVVVSGDLPTPLIDLNGASNVTFDGRVNGISDPNELTFVNTNTSDTSGTSTFRFINSAQANKIQYCIVKGASTATEGGNIYFATAASGTGNSLNTILNNSITSVSVSNRPVNVIYSLGSTTSVNSGNKIQNNWIFDFLNLENTSYGINIGLNSTAFTISGNSFYQTTSLIPTASAEYKVINVDNTLGNSFAVFNNYVGGSAALCNGTWTKTNANNNIFYAINLNVGSTVSNVYGNTISNFTYGNSGAASWYAINAAGGNMNIGNTSANTIGGTTGTGSILLTNASTDGAFYGISISSTGTVSCQKNNIGSVTTSNGSTFATHLYAINKTASAGTTTISNNIIGSVTTAASLSANSGSTSNAQLVYGIYSAGTGSINISGNVIANLANRTTNAVTTTRGKINGICVGGGSSNTITGNTVSNLTIANANAANDIDMSVVGINLINTVANRNISGNTIYSLSNTNASFTGFVSGIYYRGSTSGTNTVAKNFIYGLSSINAGGFLSGITISSGSTTYSNNIVSLDKSANVLYGIYDVGQASQTTNLYFNTVYIGGAGTTLNSYAMFSDLALNTRNYRNNIFNNSRSGSGKHYAIYYSTGGFANLTADYNDYYSATGGTNGKGGILAYYPNSDIKTIAALRSALTSPHDLNSVSMPPVFNSAGATIPIEYRVGAKLVGVNGTGITTDFGANSRPTTNLTMGAWETNSNKWVGTISTDWNTNLNWSGKIVPASESSIQFDKAAVNDLYLSQDRIVTDINDSLGTKKIITNGNKLTIKGDIIYANGGIDASSTGSIIEFAGNAAQSIPSGAFYNNEIYDVQINNINNVTLNGTLKLLNSITSTSGYLDAFTEAPNVIFAGNDPQSLENERFLSNDIYDLIIDNSFGVNLNTDITVSNNLTINSGKLLTISILNQMQVLGTVTNNAGSAGLVIKSSPVAPNGSFIFNNPSSKPVAATVEMYTKAFASVYNPTTKVYSSYKWQYFGIPIAKVVTNPTFFGSYVRKWVESGTTASNHWVQLVNTDSVYSFLGYEITQPVPKTLIFKGNLINSNYSSGKLAYTPGALYPGQNVLANPYTSAIDIRQMNFGDDMEKTVYLYNSGSLSDWTTGGGASSSGSNPGQYTAIPINLAGTSGIPRLIPSMQGYLVKALSNSVNATLSIPYASSLLKNTDMQRVARKISNSSSSELASTIIHVTGSRYTDRVWLFTGSGCTHNFDNGWDGLKNFSSSALMPQIYASEADGNYQINAVNDINNTELGFYPGEDSIYTLTFIHENIDAVYPALYLIDKKTNAIIDITASGTEYKFLVHSSDPLVKRFKIVTSPGMTTEAETENEGLKIFSSGHSVFVHNFSSSNGVLSIYDISGHLVSNHSFDPNGITTIELKLPVGVYFIKGGVDQREVTSRLILK